MLANIEANELTAVQYFGCRLLLNHNEEREEEKYRQAVKDAF